MAKQIIRALFLLSPKDLKRYWSKIDRSGGPDSCWLWKASLVDGYGYFCYGPKYGQRFFYAHRIAYFLEHGVDPGASLVCHTCDVRACQNPKHLFLGSQADNIHDCMAKGRLPMGDTHYLRIRPELILRGENHPNQQHPERMARGERTGGAKLTAAAVIEIRKLYASGWLLREIGAKFGVSEANVCIIVQRKTWAHVK